MFISIQIMIKKLGLAFSLLTVVNLFPSAQAEVVTASGAVSTSCDFLSNSAGSLVASNDLKNLGTVYGSQPRSINYSVAVAGASVMDFSEPSVLSYEGNDVTAEVSIIETVAYRDTAGNEVNLGSPTGLVQLTTGGYDFVQDLSISKVDDSEFAPGQYEYTKNLICSGGVVDTEVTDPELPVE